MKDFAGNDLRVGDVVVYCRTLGNGMELSIRDVLGFTPKCIRTVNPVNEKPVTISPSNCVLAKRKLESEFAQRGADLLSRLHLMQIDDSLHIGSAWQQTLSDTVAFIESAITNAEADKRYIEQVKWERDMLEEQLFKNKGVGNDE